MQPTYCIIYYSDGTRELFKVQMEPSSALITIMAMESKFSIQVYYYAMKEEAKVLKSSPLISFILGYILSASSL
jgi:hypothetical protein